MDELGRSEYIGGLVYACPDDIAAKRTAFKRSKDDAVYTTLVSVIVFGKFRY